MVYSMGIKTHMENSKTDHESLDSLELPGSRMNLEC